MVMHPWARTPSLATTIGLMMGSVGIINSSFNIEEHYIIRLIFIDLGLIALFTLSILFLFLLGLTIRDYIDLYPKFTRNFFGIKWLKY